MSATKNVLFIIIDQLRADCISGDLAAYVNLPNIRAFQQESVRFDRHFSVMNPCGPSRASILTGQYGMNHRSIRNGTPLRHDIPNVATEMRKAGYLPMLWGYTDTSQDPRMFHPNDPAVRTYEFPMPGFHEMLEMRMEESYPWQAHLKRHGYDFEKYWDVYRPVSPDGDAPKLTDPALYRAEHSDTAFLTDAFLSQIGAYHQKNWFAHLTYIRPHPPFVAPAPYNSMYDPAKMPLPARLDSIAAEKAVHPMFGPALDSMSVADFVEGFPGLEPTDDTIRALRAVYLGLATEVDFHIGRVMQFLKDSGQWDNTLVVLTADHGEMLGDRHAWGKHSVYDAAYHTPLMIRAPHSPRLGEVITLPTESIDVTPTILDWVGQEIPNSMDGRSLLPLLNGETPASWRRFTVSELDFADPLASAPWQQAVGMDAMSSSLSILRDERFTLVEFAADLPPMLFDKAGQGEFENVAANPDYAPDLARLCREMLRHRMRNTDHSLTLDMITPDGPKRASRHQ